MQEKVSPPCKEHISMMMQTRKMTLSGEVTCAGASPKGVEGLTEPNIEYEQQSMRVYL